MALNTQQLEFHGKTGEFFKIWIVNILLSIITLGIYSAWAKVRTKQYFYSNTVLMDSSFDYLADPLKILKGRALVLLVFIFYSLSVLISPMFQLGLMLIFIPLLPWVIIKALKFNMYNSAYRNIRFHFNSTYLKALWVFLGLPILVAISFGLAFPYFIREQKKFIIDNTSYGTSSFNMDVGVGAFYSIFFKVIGLTILFVSIIVGLVFALGLGENFANLNNPENISGIAFIIPFMIIPFYLFLIGFWYTQVLNLIINNTWLKQYQFASDLKISTICWIFFSNTVAILLSLGLLIPWAMIRTTNYRISHTSLMVDENAETFIAAEKEQAAAIGEEIGDFMDLDLGL